MTSVFGYEFSTVNSLLLSFLSGMLTISILKRNQNPNNKIKKPDLFRKLTFLISAPIIISLINSVFTGFCSFWDGILFYIVITVPSVIIGSSLGAIIFFLVGKFKLLLFILLYFFLLLMSVFEIYFNHQVYLYNPIFGYFPGTIYDEGIRVTSKLILYRVIDIVFFLPVLLFLFRKRYENYSKLNLRSFYISILIMGLIYYFILSPIIGFTVTDSRLKSFLPIEIESEHFIIYADNRIEEKDLDQILLNSEYYYDQLKLFFKDEPRSKVSVFIFFDNGQKRELFGSANANVAKPWLNSIYFSYDGWEETLKHEIAHCFTANFGTGIFKLAAGYNPAIIEGVAEAADGFYDENDIHFIASIAYKNNFRIGIASLFTGFNFLGNLSSLSYIYAGSFIKYLVDEYGIEKVEEFYRTNDFEKSFNKKLVDVSNAYEKFINELESTISKEEANYYFGRKPLIRKICPRFIASGLEDARRYFSNKDYNSASDILNNILLKAENYSAVAGLAKIFEEQDSLGRAIDLLENNMKNYLNTGSEYELKFRLAELYIKNSENEKARELYNYLAEVKPGRRLEILAKTRISLLNKDLIGSYVEGSDFDKYSILKKLNSKSYVYSSMPLMIELSSSLKEDYELFLINFKNNFEVSDELSSYAVFKISDYMLKNSDYVNARKFAGLAIRFKGDTNLFSFISEHYKKTEWFVKNADRLIHKNKSQLTLQR
ncbi:MAG: tetratricopeptide repeat protein [Ignavibacteriales bacterium]